MSEVLQANIFFYITSVAVVLVTILIIVVLFYVISILRNVKDVSDKVKHGTEILGEDLEELRGVFKKEGSKMQDIISFVLDKITPKKRTRRTKKVAE